MLVELIKMLLDTKRVTGQDLAGLKICIRFLPVRCHELEDLLSNACFAVEEFLFYELKQFGLGESWSRVEAHQRD